MNYAEDRLDRRARNVDADNDGLARDWESGLNLIASCVPTKQAEGHKLLGRTLRDMGWISRASFHYGQAWMIEPSSSQAAGDYAQMAEFCGYPEIGVLSLLHFRSQGELKQAQVSWKIERDRGMRQISKVNQQSQLEEHCGCGCRECGFNRCFLPYVDLMLVNEAISEYVTSFLRKKSLYEMQPTSYQVHSRLAKGEEPHQETFRIPFILRYWENNHGSLMRELNDVLLLLLTKLLYITIPSLAAEGVVHLNFDGNAHNLARDYKSHWAYFVLVKSVMMGERIKPARRFQLPEYHVPVWDLLFTKDHRRELKGTLSAEHVSLPVVLTLEVNPTFNPPQRLLPPSFSVYKPLFLIGDSHVLSIAWQTLQLPSGEKRLLVPIVVTGLKAWHTQGKTRFFTKTTLDRQLDRIAAELSITSSRCILMSAGEIDCREGLGGQLLEGNVRVMKDSIRRTVQVYVDSLVLLSAEHRLQILVLPVAPHAYRSAKQGRSEARNVRRQTTELWNSELRRLLPREGVFFLDYANDLVEEGYMLKKRYDADSTHMNSAFLPALERALFQCGCEIL